MEILAEAVKYFIGKKEILKGIDLALHPKEFLGIIGPNGSGKSTFLKCVYRVQKPTEGTIRFDGKLLDEMSYRESALKLAVVAQHNYYNFDFSVRDVVLMGRSPHKKTMERDNAQDLKIVKEALETVGMTSFQNRSFATLSGGEQQRVILARALAQQTPCLILDEPTNHLDITYQLQIMDIVKNLNCTIIAAIHDLNIAAMYCTKLYVMKDGRLVDSGTPEAILTKEMLRQVYQVDGEVYRDEKGYLRIVYYPKIRR